MSAEKIGPIKPKEVADGKKKSVPNEVFESFNELITENYNNGRARVLQKEVVSRMISKGLDNGQIYKNGWLDIEEVYEKAGWEVKYDKPGWDETYDSYFVFSRKRQKASDW